VLSSVSVFCSLSLYDSKGFNIFIINIVDNQRIVVMSSLYNACALKRDETGNNNTEDFGPIRPVAYIGLTLSVIVFDS